MKGREFNWEDIGLLEGVDKKRELKRLLDGFAKNLLSGDYKEIENIALPIYAKLYHRLKLPLGKFELIVDELELLDDATSLWKVFKPLEDVHSLDIEAECCLICVDMYIEKLKKNYKIKR